MNKKNKKGFTIIELIVVIAIIAVLAAIVLVNVTSYINKGKDAAAEGNLATALTNGAVYYDTNSNYTSFFTSSGFTTVTSSLTAAGYATTSAVKADGTAWCACTQMKATTTNYYCVDSSGGKKMQTTACSTECVAATALCL